MWTWLDKVLHEPVATTEHLQQQRTSLVWVKLFVFALGGYALFGLSSAALRGGLSLVFSPLLVPAIFLGALFLSVPALYIFSSFLGSQMHPKQTVALGLIALVVPALVLAGMAPIHWFLAVSTGSSKIMMTCNIGASILAGLLGFFEIRKVWASLEPHRMTPPEEMPSLHTMQGIVHRDMRAARFPKGPKAPNTPESPEVLAIKFEDIREKEVVSLEDAASKTEDYKPSSETKQEGQPTSSLVSSSPNLETEDVLSEVKEATSEVTLSEAKESVGETVQHTEEPPALGEPDERVVSSDDTEEKNSLHPPKAKRECQAKVRARSQASQASFEPKPDTSNVQDRLLTVWLFCYLGILLKLLHSFGPMLGWVG
ncbi:MAG: hypothetical protein EP343_15980 [Deltaproteobacteria bacterium]|nr:MAG: hypothetical protein EP343_15980 [Deltaproteobacteria bacterium]